VNNAYARLVIETNKTINLLNALRLTNTNAPATNETKLPTALAARPTSPPRMRPPLPQISIGAIVITNTAVSFTDRSIQPNVNLAIQSVNGSIAGLSTEQLQHADIALNAMIDGVGPASITGTINPFSGTQTNNIKISVKDMDLTPASPYAGKFAGYRIAEGKLNLDLAYELSEKVAVEKRHHAGSIHVRRKGGQPGRHASAGAAGRRHFEGSRGKIVLDVPIEGSLDDPKFRISKGG
jgi:hypothetical protein